MLRGAAWMIGMRFAIRGLGLISVAILARLLSPSDFGIVAMAMVVIELVTSFQAAGIDQALIRMRVINLDHYYTAWTIEVLLGFAIGVVLALLAPVTAAYFDDPRLRMTMWILGLAPVLSGLTNVRLLDFRRDMNFRREFTFNIIVRCISISVGIFLAYYYRNYFALIGGIVSSSAIRLIASYIFIPFRPRFSLIRWREIWSFSAWIAIRSVANVISGKIDLFIVARLFGEHDMGGYSTGEQVTSMIIGELVLPAGRSLLPGYARIVDERERLATAHEKVLSFHIAFSIPLAAGLFLVAPHLVPVLLGAQWIGFVSVFQALALSNGALAIIYAADPLFAAAGTVRTIALIRLAQIPAAVLVLWAIVSSGGDMLAIAYGRFAVNALIMIALVYLSARLLGCSFARFIVLFLRPSIAVGVMTSVVLLADHISNGHIMGLALQCISGVLGYTVALVAIWIVADRPDGVESELIERLPPLRRLLARR